MFTCDKSKKKEASHVPKVKVYTGVNLEVEDDID
jgi:hypothetical protein